MIKPEKLSKGDTIAAISPSWGCAGAPRVLWKYRLGCERLKELGFNVVAAPNSLRGTSYLRDNPQAKMGGGQKPGHFDAEIYLWHHIIQKNKFKPHSYYIAN